MPMAGRITPKTSVPGMCTTSRHSPVSTRTFTITLKPRPKNALVSPLVQKGNFRGGAGAAGAVAVAVEVIGVCSFGGWGGRNGRSGKGLEVLLGGGDPAEDATLGGDHGQAGTLELGEVGADAVGQHQALI